MKVISAKYSCARNSALTTSFTGFDKLLFDAIQFLRAINTDFFTIIEDYYTLNNHSMRICPIIWWFASSVVSFIPIKRPSCYSCSMWKQKFCFPNLVILWTLFLFCRTFLKSFLSIWWLKAWFDYFSFYLRLNDSQVIDWHKKMSFSQNCLPWMWLFMNQILEGNQWDDKIYEIRKILNPRKKYVHSNRFSFVKYFRMIFFRNL